PVLWFREEDFAPADSGKARLLPFECIAFKKTRFVLPPDDAVKRGAAFLHDVDGRAILAEVSGFDCRGRETSFLTKLSYVPNGSVQPPNGTTPSCSKPTGKTSGTLATAAY